MNIEKQFYAKEWLRDGQILCYRFEDTSRFVADHWYNDIVSELSRWDAAAGKLLHILLDLRNSRSFTVSPQALIRARQVTKAYPNIPGKSVVVITNPAAAQLIAATMRVGMGTTRKHRIFTDEGTAILWLSSNFD